MSVTVTEPRFTLRDKALLLASRRADQVERNRYGVPMSEATDPKLQDRWQVENITDFSVKTLNAETDRWRKQHGDVVDMDALLWTVRQKTDDSSRR